MPLATSARPPPALTSKPRAPSSSRPGSAPATVSKRRWNAPPAHLFPSTATPRTVAKKPATAALPTVSADRSVPLDPRGQFRATIAAIPSHKERRASRSDSLQQDRAKQLQVPAVTDPPGAVASPPTSRRNSQSARIRRSSAGYQHTGAVEPPERVPAPSLHADPKRQQLLAREAEVNALQSDRRRDSFHSAQVLKSLRRQDVEADDVSPLIEIIYWSPFVEVRRDAAAAIASLSRNGTFF
ncbi:hypothetical protein DVH05_001698 [Phytophthora capsici]|nr:hypothetical protein DVH05_001698 [Phytophthora capsici]